MKRFLLPIFSALLLSACGSDEPKVVTSTPDPSNPGQGGSGVNFYVSPPCSDCISEVAVNAGRDINDFIGHGYDITGAYLSSSSVRATVDDVNKMSSNVFYVMQAPAVVSGEIYYGKNATELLATLMASIDEQPSSDRMYYFTGTLGNVSGNSAFYLHSQYQRMLIGRYSGTSSTIRRYLSDEFLADCEELSPMQLVEKYGTHILTGASVGIAVRSLYSAYLPVTDQDMPKSLEKGFLAAYDALCRTDKENLNSTLASLSNFGAKLTVTFSGGDPAMVPYDEADASLGNFGNWWNSGDRHNYALINLSKGDLQPLTAAISDPELREEVDFAIERYIVKAQKKLDTILPLYQNSNGVYYRYITDAETASKLEQQGLATFGILGGLSTVKTDEATLPLYTSIDSEGSQILSLIQPSDSWTCLGYVYPSRRPEAIPLYEISDGNRYAYTIEAANSYGPRNEWHPTGAVFYLMRP